MSNLPMGLGNCFGSVCEKVGSQFSVCKVGGQFAEGSKSLSNRLMDFDYDNGSEFEKVGVKFLCVRKSGSLCYQGKFSKRPTACSSDFESVREQVRDYFSHGSKPIFRSAHGFGSDFGCVCV